MKITRKLDLYNQFCKKINITQNKNNQICDYISSFGYEFGDDVSALVASQDNVMGAILLAYVYHQNIDLNSHTNNFYKIIFNKHDKIKLEQYMEEEMDATQFIYEEFGSEYLHEDCLYVLEFFKSLGISLDISSNKHNYRYSESIMRRFQTSKYTPKQNFIPANRNKLINTIEDYFIGKGYKEIFVHPIICLKNIEPIFSKIMNKSNVINKFGSRDFLINFLCISYFHEFDKDYFEYTTCFTCDDVYCVETKQNSVNILLSIKEKLSHRIIFTHINQVFEYYGLKHHFYFHIEKGSKVHYIYANNKDNEIIKIGVFGFYKDRTFIEINTTQINKIRQTDVIQKIYDYNVVGNQKTLDEYIEKIAKIDSMVKFYIIDTFMMPNKNTKFTIRIYFDKNIEYSICEQ